MICHMIDIINSDGKCMCSVPWPFTLFVASGQGGTQVDKHFGFKDFLT